MPTPFTLIVKDIYTFRDGRTIFVGEIPEAPQFIGSCNCDLIAEDRRILTLTIEGEMLPNNRPDPQERVVSTTDPIDVADLSSLKQLRLSCR